MTRPAIIVALPPSESVPVCAELLTAGFEVIEVDRPVALESALDARRDVALAILDGETDDDTTRAYTAALRGAGRSIPALSVVSPRAFERLTGTEDDGTGDEYFTRPYSADSIRWRVEAMCIRRETVDDGSGPILQGGGPVGFGGATRAHDCRGVQPEGRRGQDDRGDQPGRGVPGPGQVGPADRRGHGHRPCHHVARYRGLPHCRRQLA